MIARLEILSRMAYAAHSNHLIAISRTTCAFVLLLFAVTDASLSRFPSDFSDVFAIAFAGFAAFTITISFGNWYVDFTASKIFLTVDTLAFAAFLSQPMPQFGNSIVPPLCMIAHILFGCVLRWRFGVGIAFGVLLNFAWIADIAMIELSRGGIERGEALRLSLLAPIGSLIVLWTSAQSLRIPLPRFTGEQPDPGLPLAASALSYAMRTACASNVILCWIDREDFGCYACSAGSLEDELPPRRLSFAAAGAFKKLVPMIFDASRGKAIVLGNEQLPSHPSSDLPGRMLLMELGGKAGICIPADSDEGRSWLILTGMPLLGWGHLKLARSISWEVAKGMSWQTASARALESALSSLRRTVACDLHDSVAHSLAGAKFLLTALRSKVGAGSEAAREIDTIRAALDSEHQHVRRLIEQLRRSDVDSTQCNLVEDLKAIRPTLAARWQITVELVDTDFRIAVPVWISLGVQQIVREAVSNSARHGKATKVAIKCQKRWGAVEVEVTDDGVGFVDPDAPASPRSIRERLGELSGSLEVASLPGSTTLRMSIPSIDMD